MFYHAQKVYILHTDLSGIVYHPNYLSFAEQARTAWLYDLGFSVQDFLDKKNYFVVRHVDIDYIKPLQFYDDFIVVCELLSHRSAQMTLKQSIYITDGDPSTIKSRDLYHTHATTIILQPDLA